MKSISKTASLYDLCIILQRYEYKVEIIKTLIKTFEQFDVHMVNPTVPFQPITQPNISLTNSDSDDEIQYCEYNNFVLSEKSALKTKSLLKYILDFIQGDYCRGISVDTYSVSDTTSNISNGSFSIPLSVTTGSLAEQEQLEDRRSSDSLRSLISPSSISTLDRIHNHIRDSSVLGQTSIFPVSMTEQDRTSESSLSTRLENAKILLPPLTNNRVNVDTTISDTLSSLSRTASMLSEVIKIGDEDAFHNLINTFPFISKFTTPNGSPTPLSTAIQYNKWPIVNILIENGVANVMHDLILAVGNESNVDIKIVFNILDRSMYSSKKSEWIHNNLKILTKSNIFSLSRMRTGLARLMKYLENDTAIIKVIEDTLVESQFISDVALLWRDKGRFTIEYFWRQNIHQNITLNRNNFIISVSTKYMYTVQVITPL